MPANKDEKSTIVLSLIIDVALSIHTPVVSAEYPASSSLILYKFGSPSQITIDESKPGNCGFATVIINGISIIHPGVLSYI